MKQLIPLFTFLLTHFAYSQTPEFDWMSAFQKPQVPGAGGTANVVGIEPLNDGGMYALLSFSGTYDMDPSLSTLEITSNGSIDIAVLRLNQNGNLVWVKHFGGLLPDFGIKLASNSSQDVFITGNFGDSVDFDPGPNQANAQSYGDRDGFILVLDSNGNYKNSKTFGGAGFDSAFEIDFDQNDQCFVSGRYIDSVDLNPEAIQSIQIAPNGMGTFIAKVDSNLYLDPILLMDGGEDCAIFDFVISQNHEIHYVEYFSDTLNAVFTDSVFQRASNGSVDVIYGVVDLQGNNSEYIHFGGPYHDWAYSLAEMSTGEFVMFVNYADSLMFNLNGSQIYYQGNNFGSLGNYYRRNTAVLKFDGVDIQWVKTANVQVVGGDPSGICYPARDIKVDENDNIYMALLVDGVCSVNQSDMNTFGSQNSSGTVLARQNSDGVFTGLYAFTGGSAIASTLEIVDDNLFLGIGVLPEVDFDFTETLWAPYVAGACVAKYNLQDPSLFTNELSETETVLYPNPTDQVLNLRVSDASNLFIHDLSGREVKPNLDATGDTYQINTSQLANGVYTLSYEHGDKTFTERFIIRH